MKKTVILLLAFSAAITGYQCGENGLTGRSSGLRVSGNLTGASGLQVFLDKTGVNPASASTVIGKADADASGAFNIELPENPEPGLYRLRAGAQRVNLVVDEKDHDIKLSGELGSLNMFQYQVSGSSGSVAYQQVMQRLAARQFTIEHLKAFVDTTSSPLAAMVIAIQSMGNNTASQFMDIHKAAQARLKAASTNSKMNEDYAAYLASLQSVKAAGSNFQFVEEAERQAAPDIRLPSPNGKEYALSDLKGKVVLLDFWASWCGPCRRENPNVVKIYEQYKDKGFTVFSVSLDGVDPRQMIALQSDPKNVAKAMADQKKRWKDAITQDGLVWDYHVSELKKWDCAPAKQYGVSSIPRTFMIDKEGRIAASNLRGEAIEEVLLKLL